jgi:hypothetical protein
MVRRLNLLGGIRGIFTVLAMMLIDRMGRKFLLLIGSAGMAVCLAGVASIFYTMRHQETLLWCLIGFIAFFAFSQGTVVWVYLSEVFPTSAREKGQSLGTFSLVGKRTCRRIFSPNRGDIRRRPLCALFRDDDYSVFRGSLHLPRNQGSLP